MAAVPVGGRAWPDNEPTRREKLAARTAHGRVTTHRHTQRPGTTGVEGAGGSGGHGRASRQRTETHTSMPVAADVEGVGGTGGPGRGARGRRRGLAGTTQHRRRHRRGGRRRVRRARAGFETTHRDTHQHASRRRCGGRRRDRRAWPRCPWAAAGTGRHHTAPKAPPAWRAPEGPEGTGGLRDRPLRAAGSRVAISRAAGPDGARNTRGATSNTSRKAAAHGNNQQPGPAGRAKRPARQHSTPRGATRNTAQGRGPTGPRP